MKIFKEGNIWAAESRFHEKDILKGAGFWWDPNLKRWYTKSPEVAAKLSQYTDEDTAKDFQKQANEKAFALKASRAIDSGYNFPCPEGLSYFSFQRAGIAYALNRLGIEKPFQELEGVPKFIPGRGVLIADEPGLGKTIQAVGVINSDKAIKTVLVVCPASVKINWKREIQKWLLEQRLVGIHYAGRPKEANIVIVNWDLLGKKEGGTITALPEIIDKTWDLVVVDESHMAKSPKTIRTRALKQIVKKAKRKIFLTGTPVLNRPIELFPVLNMIAPKDWGNWMWFAKRYCGGFEGKWGWDTSGATNLDELQDKLRASCMIRRRKSEVLLELPAKIRQVIEIPQNGFGNIIKKEREQEQKWAEVIAEIELEIDKADVEDSQERYKLAIGKLNGVKRAMFSEMAKLRHETALAKVPEAINFIKELLEAQSKVVVYAHHHDVISQLETGLKDYDPAVLTGETDNSVKMEKHVSPGDNQKGLHRLVEKIEFKERTSDRQKAIDRFQNDPECRVFIGSITAAGLGITLTAASTEVFVELDWVPANITQAEDRCHRIGQKDSVLVYHLVIDGSLDAKLARAIISKQQVADRTLDIEPQRGDDFEIPAEEEIASSSEQPQLPKKSTLIAVEDMDEIQLIHRQLKFMAGLDPDYARATNGIGFNKFDGDIGHQLAERIFITPKQAALGKKILKKYHKQLEMFI